MKKFIATLSLLTALSAHAGYNDWATDTQDKFKISTGLLVVDAMQTVTIAQNPTIWTEVNPILGAHPSVSAVLGYFGIVIALHYVITDALKPEHKNTYLNGVTALESVVVVHNFSLGLPPSLP